ncbi:hypothetical protein EVAR_20073_1 [Eumeta japonica]|uniref:Uncharacterized protein n=1 Tax=Eumeta variegata TaxID=151549 RepID=A0A4C1UI19_EUMVA|nr:hypothetical protein EVAR_20073_1 [Eumeta japonica]
MFTSREGKAERRARVGVWARRRDDLPCTEFIPTYDYNYTLLRTTRNEDTRKIFYNVPTKTLGVACVQNQIANGSERYLRTPVPEPAQECRRVASGAGDGNKSGGAVGVRDALVQFLDLYRRDVYANDCCSRMASCKQEKAFYNRSPFCLDNAPAACAGALPSGGARSAGVISFITPDCARSVS